MEYKHDDLIIPLLGNQGRLPSPCTILVKVNDDRIVLVVGPRDWLWDRKTGKMIGAGTMLRKSIQEMPDTIEVKETA